MAKIIHSMVRVLHLDASLKFYADCFGLQPAHRLDFPSFSLVYLRNAENDAEIELTWNRDRTEPYTHGDGYGHVGVCVADAVADRARLLGLDAPTKIAPTDPDGNALPSQPDLSRLNAEELNALAALVAKTGGHVPADA